MPHDVVVVGASSGGLEPLIKLVGGLPADLPASVFVVVHVRPDTPSHLPAILNRSGPLPAAHAVDGEPIRRGRIYVAPPGLHTYVHRGHISVARGPYENSTRPAIDPLFRTAAHHYGRRVVGVILSGALDDGSAGLEAIKRAGGCAIVQDPDDAGFPDMPANAIDRTQVDYCVPAEQLALRVVEIVRADGNSDVLPVEVPLETIEEAPSGEPTARSEDLGRPSGFTCPDCSGALWEIEDGAGVRYRCRVGHAYSEDAMVSAQTDAVERALWTARRALEERAALIHKLADSARRSGHDAVATLFDGRSRQMDADIKAIQDVIASGWTLEPVGHEGT